MMKEKRTSELMTAFQKTRSIWEQKAKEDDKNLHQVWQQQGELIILIFQLDLHVVTCVYHVVTCFYHVV